MQNLKPILLSISFAAAAALLAACGTAQSNTDAPVPPKVSVAAATRGEVTDWDEFTGRFEAPERVELRPRVSGYIEGLHFVEGSEVKKGDLLFQIDPRPYRADLDRAEADLARVKARVALAETELGRSSKLLGLNAVSREEYDQRSSQREQAGADMRVAQAAVEVARLNLEFTRVTAPIDGRISRALVTTGNYVNAGQTPLTSLVSIDPLYVYFETDEQTFLKYAEQAQRGERPEARGAQLPVQVGLASESGHPHEGRVDFIDNAVDAGTGTIRARAVLDNRERRFTPGLFARIRLVGSGQYAATLVDDAAVGTDQDRRYVLVVGHDGTVEYRTVQLGSLHEGQRVVREGLKPGEQVVVSGLQRARPGSKVTPEPVNQPAQASVDAPAKS